MVLKNSKYDKQAKRKYMAKHGLLSKQGGSKDGNSGKTAVKPKWTSKKKSQEQQTMTLDIDEMTSDWDSDIDEDIVNYFYPQLSEEIGSTPLDQKKTIKRQIIEDLRRQRDDIMNQSEPEEEEQEQEGIYLGSQESRTKHHARAGSESKKEVKLTDFLPEIPISNKHLNRKLPKAQESEHFLQEYGIENYKDIIRTKDDYDTLHKKKLESRNLDEILADELVGFRVGKDSLSGKPSNSRNHIRSLTKEEIEQEQLRKNKDEQNKFYSHMKQKFQQNQSADNKSKVLDLNNYRSDNPHHIDYLNSKIINQDGSKDKRNEADIDDDLDDLLGAKLAKVELEDTSEPTSNTGDVDAFLQGLNPTESRCQTDLQERSTEFQQASNKPNTTDEKFLDDLLDI